MADDMADDGEPSRSSTQSQKPGKQTPKGRAAKPAPSASAAYQEASRLTGQLPGIGAFAMSGRTLSGAGASGGNMAASGRRGSRHPRPEGDVIGPHDEIIFEFGQRGDFVQVSAMHGPTLTEVSVIGSPQATPRELEQLALSKLRFVLRKKLEKG
ncbi:MAG: hypothetical protein AAF556_07595 [Pseudomonadota bacterium]